MRKIIPITVISILAILLLAGCTETTKDNTPRTYTGEIYDALLKQRSWWEFWGHDKATILFTDGYSIDVTRSENSSLTVAGVYAFCKDHINKTVEITFNKAGVVYGIEER